MSAKKKKFPFRLRNTAQPGSHQEAPKQETEGRTAPNHKKRNVIERVRNIRNDRWTVGAQCLPYPMVGVFSMAYGVWYIHAPNPVFQTTRQGVVCHT